MPEMTEWIFARLDLYLIDRPLKGLLISPYFMDLENRGQITVWRVLPVPVSLDTYYELSIQPY